MQFGELKLNLWTLIGSQKISITLIDLKILSQTRRESANFPTSLIEFGNRMQKLQHFELELKVCGDNIGSLGCLGFKFSKGRI